MGTGIAQVQITSVFNAITTISVAMVVIMAVQLFMLPMIEVRLHMIDILQISAVVTFLMSTKQLASAYIQRNNTHD